MTKIQKDDDTIPDGGVPESLLVPSPVGSNHFRWEDDNLFVHFFDPAHQFNVLHQGYLGITTDGVKEGFP